VNHFTPPLIGTLPVGATTPRRGTATPIGEPDPDGGADIPRSSDLEPEDAADVWPPRRELDLDEPKDEK